MFDPYHKWLGIPPGKRPPSPYQLLAVSETEKDRDVIEAATVRQSAYVRHFQNGPNGEQATKILAEISDARDVLIDPSRRSKLDESLAALKPKPKAVSPVAKAVAATTGQAVVVRASPVPKSAAPKNPNPSRRPSQRAKPGVSIPILIGILGVVATATGLGVYFATRGSGTQPTASNDATAKRSEPNPAPFTSPIDANPATQPPPVKEQSNSVHMPPMTIPNPGPPPGFGQPPPGFGQRPAGIGQPTSGFGPRPPNIGPPKGFTAPPGLFRASGDNPKGSANTGEKGQSPLPNDSEKTNPRKREDVSPSSEKKQSAEGLDGTLEKLQSGNHFDREARQNN